MAFLFLVFSLWAQAFHQVDSFIDHRTIVVQLESDHNFQESDRVVVISLPLRKLSALGSVVKITESESQTVAIVAIDELFGEEFIIPGDAMEKLTKETLQEYNLTAHISLFLDKEESVPARYKDLPYLGLFNSDGHTLSNSEWLVSIPQVQYGMSDRWTVKFLNSLLLDGFINAGLKTQIMRNQWGHLSMNTLVARQVNRDDWVTVAGLVLTLPSNQKYQSHLIINARIEGINEDNPEVDKLNLFPASDIRTIYEYIRDDWNRLLFGPLFNFQSQTVGGTISHMWIWNSFHLNLGLATQDVTELKFGTEGFYPVFDFFWRF